MDNKELSFEECIMELENILRSMDKTDITLEESVKGYTKGLELSKKAYEILSTNEELIVQKMTESGLVEFKNS